VRQIAALGFDPRDVRHIVMSHLDFDHARGLDDFSEATVHLLADEREAAFAQRTTLDRMRYRPQQWSSQARWRVYAAGDGEPWQGFDAVRDLEGVPPEILMVPLIGHTLGHCGVVIDGERPMNVERPRCTPGLRMYQWMMEKNRRARLWNQRRLRELKRRSGDAIELFCAHDTVEFDRLARHSFATPAQYGASPIAAAADAADIRHST